MVVIRLDINQPLLYARLCAQRLNTAKVGISGIEMPA